MPTPKRRPVAALHPAPPKNARPAALRPTVQVLPRPAIPINHNFNLGRYPWDDYQDRVVVNSVETKRAGQLTGVQHYRQILSERTDYKHVCSDFEEYRRSGKGRENAVIEKEEEHEGVVGGLDPRVDYTKPPTPPASLAAYTQPIYKASTRNPAVFLAIIRIAQANLPFLDFESATNHLPNLPHNAALPTLPPKQAFIDDVPHVPKPSDVELTVMFLPHFYQDGRHCIGYYNIEPNPNSPTRWYTKTCLLTPCSTADIHTYHLVERQDEVDKIGGRKGGWVSVDVVEEYEAWSLCWKVASSVWETRMRLYRGAEEGEGGEG
jgi:hypothetical protein